MRITGVARTIFQPFGGADVGGVVVLARSVPDAAFVLAVAVADPALALAVPDGATLLIVANDPGLALAVPDEARPL